MDFFAVISDDLTGAMDAGLQMFNKNMTVRIAISINDLASIAEGSDCVVINTQSRNCSPEEAYEKTDRAVKQLLASSCNIIYKKIDSTLRGHVGTEIRAVLDSGAFDCVIVAPALPFNKRTTENGIHFVGGVKLADTELAKDPFSPICYSAISDIIKQGYDGQSGLINIKLVRKGALAIADEIKHYVQNGVKVIIADAIEDEDLRNIAVGAKLFEGSKVLCGSAGLFKYFDEAYEIEAKRDKTGQLFLNTNRSRPILAICGSPAAMSKMQIKYITEKRQDVKLINLYITSEFCDDILDVTNTFVLEKVIRSLKSGYDTIVDAAGESKESILKEYHGRKEELDKVSSLILQVVSDIAYGVVTQVPIAGLVIFGGDTAAAIADRLNVKGIEITEQVEPYIPRGIFIGGALPNLPVVTKAGGFGRENSLAVIFDSFRRDEDL